jgi:cyclic beta-1,2-glucan synthetase
MRIMNPIEHARTPEDVKRYMVEPYVVSADVYQLPGRVGQGGWTWYTGSSGWMYRVWVEEILGLKVRGEKLSIAPVIPSSWDGFEMRYRNGKSVYEIKVENPNHVSSGVVSIELDGNRLETDYVHLQEDQWRYNILVRMGE